MARTKIIPPDGLRSDYTSVIVRAEMSINHTWKNGKRLGELYEMCGLKLGDSDD